MRVHPRLRSLEARILHLLLARSSSTTSTPAPTTCDTTTVTPTMVDRAATAARTIAARTIAARTMAARTMVPTTASSAASSDLLPRLRQDRRRKIRDLGRICPDLATTTVARTISIASS